jgi:hypothetical protein
MIVVWVAKQGGAHTTLVSLLSAACFIGALASFWRYKGIHFDLLILSGGDSNKQRSPSFEVDTSIEELRSINHRLLDLQAVIEKSQ